MVDPGFDAVLFQCGVHASRPGFAPFLDQSLIVPLPDLVAEAIGIDMAKGEHDVRMFVALVTLLPGRVHRTIGHHAKADKFIADEAYQHGATLLVRELEWQRNFDLAHELGILALFDSLYCVPELATVAHPVRGGGGSKDESLAYTTFAGEVENFAGSRIFDSCGGAIGCGSGG